MEKTRNVEKTFYANYLKKAEEYFSAMHNEFNKGNFDSCVLCAIHCCISAADALTIFFKGIRHAEERHENAVKLLSTLTLGNIQNKIRQFLNVLTAKNAVEYEEKLTTENGALTAMQNTERFFNWVKETLHR